MNEIKNVYKPTPERFENNLRMSIKEAGYTKSKKNVRKKIKIAVCIAVILAMIPTTVYGAPRLQNLIAERYNNFGLKISTSNSNFHSPEYVKLNVSLPKEFKPIDNTNGTKFCSVESESVSTYSFHLTRPTDGAKELYSNVENYKSTIINGHDAVIMSGAGTNEFTRVSIFFEDVNIIANCFVSPDISEENMLKALEGISITEGTENNHNTYTETEKSNLFSGFAQLLTTNPRFTLCHEDDSLQIYDKITMKVENIKTIDNVSHLSKNDFYFWGDNPNAYIMQDGSLSPRTSDIWEFGDGIKSTDKFIKAENKEQTFVLADVTYSNTSSEDLEFSINLMLNYLDKSFTGKLSLSEKVKNDMNLDDGLCQYIKNANQDLKSFYVYTISPGETRTFTVGYRCDKDLIDNAYLANCKGSDNSNHFYAIKVTDNG